MGVGLFNQGFFMNNSTGRAERRDGRSARQRRRSTLAHCGVTGEARIILRQRSAPTGHLVTYLIRGYLRATKISTLKISNTFVKYMTAGKKKVNTVNKYESTEVFQSTTILTQNSTV